MGIVAAQVAFPPIPIKESADADAARAWYAVFITPQHEKSAVRQLGFREIESFLPTYESARKWKNGQRVTLTLPLFPSYLFVHINQRERSKVLQSPGVLHIVGNHRAPLPVPDEAIHFLRSGLCARNVEPYTELVAGQRVRIKSGALQGVQGTLVRRNNRNRFVLTIELINRHAAIEVDASALEPVTAGIQ